MAFLQATEGPLTGQKFVVPDRDRVIIGRYEIYDLVVPDPSISRKHFAVEKRPDGFYVVDLGSLNGTQLNGHRVSTAKLEEDDRISAGQSVLAFHEKEGAAAPAAADAEADVEVLSDDDIITVDPDAAQESPATIPMPVASPPEEAEGAEDKPRRKSTGREPAKTRRTVKKGSGKSKAGKSAGRCAACGRKVTQEDVDTGDCAKTRLGFVCSRCIEKRQKSGEKGSLETFITERQKRRR
ncbi:MAG: FHA domain-containing protein [Planctomycetota bacterium]|jgi:pSer/pThr/pTyr-binding forkhead associated (FHA) protein